ncbi:hypothetical protein Pint_06516 [Pistacia integerrima]|uniref:Uncharacterized protein n=1 Tax=Pistacia integerrima TaxID=434235 RepID=A0ACC0Z7T2_9ROSI|nr:hypothetical protein Pint_06516 [Pistacia integerrima]
MATKTRLVSVTLLWILVLFATLAFIQNRLSDVGVSSEQKIASNKLTQEENVEEELDEVTHKVYFDIEVGGKPIGMFC